MQNRPLFNLLVVVLFQFIFIFGAVAQVKDSGHWYQIESVRLEGNRRIDSAAIVAQLEHKHGRVNADQISGEVKALYKTGFFSNVTAVVVPTSEGQILKYTLVEKPVVRKVFIKGNKEVSESDLREVFKFGTNRFLDRSKIFALIRNAIGLYQVKGYYDASFDYSVSPVGDDMVDLVLTVVEGKRYKVREIKINGLENIDEDDLLDVMETSDYSWWSSWLLGTGRLNQDLLDRDKSLMRQYFLDHGYIDATLSDPIIKAEDGDITISFNVIEGREYKYGEITASGEPLDKDPETILDKVESKSGEPFSAAKLREDAFKVSEKYTDLGYAFANIVPQTRIRRDEGLVDIDFAATKGKMVSVDRIKIKGNDKTYDNVIRRELKIAEQERYSSSKIKRSQVLLERLGYFDEVSITSEPTAKDDKVDLSVNVREGSTGSFSAGVGFSSGEGLLFNSRLSENNVLGTGRNASINLDIGTENDSINVGVSDRRINDSYVSGGANLYRTFREFSDFDRTLSGGSIEFGYPLDQAINENWEGWDGGLEYRYVSVEIEDVDRESSAQLVIDSEGTSTASSIIPKLTRNTINNPLDPRSGSKQLFSFEVAGLGAEEDFYVFELRNQWYYPMFDIWNGPVTFSWRFTVGYGESNTDDPFPLYKRYFPGGINSVRGYKSRSLGPKDEEGNEYGGSKQLINNLEVIFPLIPSSGLKGVVFYDAGEAFDDDVDIELSELRLAYGFGIRWTSPAGPIRVEFGFPIDKEDGESSMVTLFSLGAPF